MVVGVFVFFYIFFSGTPEITENDILQKRLEATGLIKVEKIIEENSENTEEDLPPEKAELMLPVYKYFTFQLPFVANLSSGKRLVTVELAVSKLLPGLDGESFLEAIKSFEPALRSKILTYINTLSADELVTAKDKNKFRKHLKKIVNEYLTGGGGESKFKVDDVHLLKFVIS